MSLVCIVCCDNLVYTRNEARLSGIEKGMVNVDNYGDGVASITLAAIAEKHEKDMFINIRPICEVLYKLSLS